jgi:SAM-dependent methyltransferase
MPLQVQLPDDRACERFYDQRYADGYMDDWPARKLERVRDILASLGLPESGTALDFGCGIGSFTAVLRDCLPGWRVLGVDLSRVAIENARRAVPGCEFHHLEERDQTGVPQETSSCHTGKRNIEPGSVDLLFTHHVLEHVRDLEQTWNRMTGFMRENSWMLHVLPCGNPGSFEHELCRLRVDGIDPDAGGRFFYEDPGHLRRLRTNDMIALAGRFGYQFADGLYSHHRFEALDWLSGNGVRFVLNLCDPAKAVDPPARRRLARIRRQLLYMALIKRVARSPGTWMRPLAALAERLTHRWTRQSQHEWQQMRSHPDGSEMYLVFQRAAGSQS